MSSFSDNPLLSRVWATPCQLPPFDLIRPEHFREAFPVCMAEHKAEVRSIMESQAKEGATFEGTVAAFDRSGALLTRTRRVFDNLGSSCSSAELQQIQREFAGVLARHSSEIYMSGLFEHIADVHARRAQLGLGGEALRLTERLLLDFQREGACFGPDAQARYASIKARLAELTTQFTQNVLADESEVFVPLRAADGDLQGLPAFLVAACAAAAAAAGRGAEHVVTLSRSLVVPFLMFSTRRDLREKAWRAWTSRGELNPARDNLAVAREILLLRAEQASMHGHSCYADYALADTMAGSPSRVEELLRLVQRPAAASAERERAILLEFAADGAPSVEPWDWRFYAEKARVARFDLDEATVKQYFPLGRMVDALFHCAGALFGLAFVRRDDFPRYHADVQTYEVWQCGASGDREKLVGIFLHDNFSRPFKNSGAWMSAFNSQCRNTEDPCNAAARLPVVINNNNFAKAPEGEETLLSYDDARTLFHEFGHGMHGLLSDVTYRRLSGTSVLLDFLELPSQLFEHWLSEPAILKTYARHVTTGEPIPDALLHRLLESQRLSQGFETVEYTASALLDLHLHQLTKADGLAELDFAEFEAREISAFGAPPGTGLRHRACHFQHLFSTSQYAAGYYSYLWAEVLDADAFAAFTETGDAFNKEVSARARRFIYSSGNSIEPGEAFRSFRGRDPVVEHMLQKKGLSADDR